MEEYKYLKMRELKKSMEKERDVKKKKKYTPEEREIARIKESEMISKYWNDPELDKTQHLIISGDSRRMHSIRDDSVQLIITSPPYFNAKEYSQWLTLSDYLQDMKKTFLECFRVLAPGRKFCLNISDLPEKGDSGVRWIPLGAELIKVVQEVGFEIVDRIIWFKTPVKGFQYGSLPFPPSPLVCDSMEYIFVLRKPGKAKYDNLTKTQKEASRLKREEYGEFTKQIWTMGRVRTKDNAEGHIAPFPDELPHRCIKLYSFVGETVLDPFGGSGTTTKMAIQNKRNSILYEINKEYIFHIKNKLNLLQNQPEGNTQIIIQNDK